MNTYFFIYRRIGKKQTSNFWKLIEAETVQKATEEGERTTFIGDFKYEFVCVLIVPDK